MATPTPITVVEPTAPPPPAQPTLQQQKAVASYWTVILLSILPSILFSLGAAKLSYDRFRSFGWAIVAFFFSAVYYPYYAFFVSGPPAMAPTGMIGAMRKAMK